VRLTISTTINATLSLAASNNPVTITVSGGVSATGTTADAIDGNSSADWAISNAGTISSLSGYGVNLAGQNSNVRNFGSISGGGGVNLSNDGSVTNTAKGAIGTVTNAEGASISGCGWRECGRHLHDRGTSDDDMTGGEDGVVVVAGAGNIQNSGVITHPSHPGVGKGDSVSVGRGKDRALSSRVVRFDVV
jgi:hypothetical protein